MYKRDISDTGTHKLQDILKEFIVLVPTDKVLEITLNYLAYDEEVRKIVVYIQSEEFPILKIHKFIEYLKEYKDVSTFMSMFLMFQSDGLNVCSVSTGVWIAFF